MSGTASRWGTREKKDHVSTPEEFDEEVRRLMDLMQTEGKLSTPGGVIRLPIDTSRVSTAVKNADHCPECKAMKFVLRPHQHDQRFCFGCGHTEPV